MKNKTKLISAEHRVTGKTTCVINLIIEEQECFVNIQSLLDKKILVTKEICQKIQDEWGNGNSVNLVLGSLTEVRNNVLKSETLNIEVENPMDDVFTG